ncbi:MAG: hypothetical protein ABSF29_07230 [Tepidisphaeraceae bacterium]|jgi:hypothetical protein
MEIEKLDINERRRSERWQCAKPIQWRVRGGRRVRQGMVPERSMSGMVIAAARQDLVPVGTQVRPGDDQTCVRHGFRAGVICRTDIVDGQIYLLFVDILA